MSLKVIGFLSLGIGVAVLGGCATHTPVSGRFPNISPRAAQSGLYNGREVRWGGAIIATMPEAKRTCFRIMALPLSADGRPRGDTGAREDKGRFIACATGFYDPFLYSKGRKITFVGTVEGIKSETVGKYRYPYPLLDATIVYLWPKRVPRPAVETMYSYPIWGPWGWWGGYPGWWGFTAGWDTPVPPVYYRRDPRRADHRADRHSTRQRRSVHTPGDTTPPPNQRPPRLVRPLANPRLHAPTRPSFLRVRPTEPTPVHHPAPSPKNPHRPRV